MNMLSSFLTPFNKRGAEVHPFKTLRQEIDHIFDAFQPAGNWPANWPAVFSGDSDNLVPNIEVKEDDKTITLSSEIPGVDESDIDVSVHDNVLTIAGEKKLESKSKDGDRFVTERAYGKFSRSTTLPFSVADNAVQAKYAKGVLTITINKPEDIASKAKRIEVKGE
ncbi:MAG: Hsp20/alpha crystallin family protein [Burkholderiaceae bacterium]